MSAFLDLVAGEIGVPYVYGGDSPSGGFDCSGLVQWAAGKVGVPLPRGATDQLHALPHTNNPGPGDLVFFNTGDGWEAGHVGVCSNAGCTSMIDAPHSGALVQMQPIAGFGTVVGYGRLPATATNASSSDGGILGSGIPNPLDAIPNPLDAAGDAVNSVTSLISNLPADFVKVLLGGHTPTELMLRGLEIVAGAALLAIGGIAFLTVIVKGGGETGRAAAGVSSSSRTVYRQARRPVDSSNARAAARKAEADKAAKAAARQTKATLTAKPGPQ